MINTGTSYEKINAIVRACRLLTRMNQAGPDARKSDVIYYRMLTDYYNRIINAKKDGNFIVAHTVFFPVEILYAMGLTPMHMETTIWMSSLFLGESSDILSAGAQLGLAPEICSPHRGVAGCFALKALPRPDVMLWSNLVCDNTAKSGELLAELNHCPSFYLDHPFQNTPEEKTYMLEQLKDMIGFLEQHSGRKMDMTRLSAIVDRMDRQLELTREIDQLRRQRPSPFPTQGFLKLLTADYLFPGQPEAIEYLEALKSELAEKVATGKGAVEPERFRLMTIFLPPLFLISFLDRFLTEHGAVSVVEPFFTQWGPGRLNPGHPLESVVEKSFLIPENCTMYGPLQDKVLTDLADTVRDYQVDGAIYWAFIGCRHTCATIKLFRDKLNEAGAPVLTMDCDIVDPTVNPQEEIAEKLERFFELLEDR
jgi:benzoyl-CoA reductase/2-hydroxyglutaryl-CoA dehydratase subunit BcrC/BadD/HgdB